MVAQLEGDTINKSQGVTRRMGMCKSMIISLTKVSFSQSATGKLILMTMIGTLISIAPARCFLSPYFNISPFPAFWCLTEWKARQYVCSLTKGTHRRSGTRPRKCHSQCVCSTASRRMIGPPFLFWWDCMKVEKRKLMNENADGTLYLMEGPVVDNKWFKITPLIKLNSL